LRPSLATPHPDREESARDSVEPVDPVPVAAVPLTAPGNINSKVASPLDPSVGVVRSKTGRPLVLVWREDGRVRTRPVLDLTGLLFSAPVAVAALALIRSLVARPLSAPTKIDMGPGGWVSFKDHATTNSPRRVVGLRRRPTRSQAAGRRPWWARALKAERFS
jgi:hypothetical protein